MKENTLNEETEKKVRALRSLEKRRTELRNHSEALCAAKATVKAFATKKKHHKCVDVLQELNSTVENALVILDEKIIQHR